jgi:hypothetical protein
MNRLMITSGDSGIQETDVFKLTWQKQLAFYHILMLMLVPHMLELHMLTIMVHMLVLYMLALDLAIALHKNVLYVIPYL